MPRIYTDGWTDLPLGSVEIRGYFCFVNESGSKATITVLRAGGVAGTATVNYATSNGTAVSGATCSAGVDYIPASGTFTRNREGESQQRGVY